MNYHLEGLTIAVTNMEQMLQFYSGLFSIEFEELEMYGNKLYAGNWDDLKVLFCPAELAKNTATQNRHQFDILVEDLEGWLTKAQALGGKIMQDIVENEGIKTAAIYDPDGNSMVLKTRKSEYGSK